MVLTTNKGKQSHGQCRNSLTQGQGDAARRCSTDIHRRVQRLWTCTIQSTDMPQSERMSNPKLQSKDPWLNEPYVMSPIIEAPIRKIMELKGPQSWHQCLKDFNKWPGTTSWSHQALPAWTRPPARVPAEHTVEALQKVCNLGPQGVGRMMYFCNTVTSKLLRCLRLAICCFVAHASGQQN